jgi:hypothetical protein
MSLDVGFVVFFGIKFLLTGKPTRLLRQPVYEYRWPRATDAHFRRVGEECGLEQGPRLMYCLFDLDNNSPNLRPDLRTWISCGIEN